MKTTQFTFRQPVRNYLQLLLIAGLLLSCGSNNRSTGETSSRALSTLMDAPQDTLVYTMRTYEQAGGDCAAGKGCATVTLRYPVITGTAKPTLRDSLAAYQGTTLFSPLYDEGPQKPGRAELISRKPETFATDFFQMFRQTMESKTSYASTWTVERTMRVLHNRSPLLTLEWSDQSYTGGAHPNYFQEYINFDTRTGEQIHLNNLLRAEARDKLTALAEAHFRQAREMPAEKSWNELGFFFKGGRFTLNDNFRIGSDGLTFLFNPYEIAPYAFGSMELFLSYADIRPLLKKNDYIPAAQ